MMSMYVQPLAFMESLGGSEIFLVVVVIFVLFGGEKLPEFARGAGKLIREFKKASSNVEEEFKRALEEEERKKTIAAPPSPSVAVVPSAPLALEEHSPATGNDLALSAPTDHTPSPDPSAAPSVSDTAPAPSLKPPAPPKMLPSEDDELLS